MNLSSWIERRAEHDPPGVAIVFEGAVGGVDTFKVTSYVNDPTKPS